MDLVRHLTPLTLQYNFYLKTKKVKKNEIADSLSRVQIERFRLLAPHAEQAPFPVRCFTQKNSFDEKVLFAA